MRYHGVLADTEKNVQRVIGYMKNHGHWGGIHAVYNLYNCTRLRELRRWADSVGAKIHWQTLYQPEYLDPGLHNHLVRDLAIEEIDRYDTEFGLASDEKGFFEAVKQRLRQDPSDLQRDRFWQHINDTENKYHKPNGTKFKDLWPELATLI